MKGTVKRTMKKIVSVILALAIVITGINYTPSTVKADGTITNDGKTYTVTGISAGDIVGLVINPSGDTGFYMAWDGTYGNTITVSENGNIIQENIGNGGSLLVSSLATLENGEHTLTFTSNADKVSTATLKIEGGTSGGGDEEESPTAPAGATWTAWGTSTDYSYYVASGEIHDTMIDADGLYVSLGKVPTSIKLNGVTVTNMMTDSGAHAKISITSFAKDGLYKLYLVNGAEEIATIYIKKGNAGETTTTTTDTLAAPSDAYVYNFVDAGQGYQLGFTENNKITNEAGTEVFRTDGTYTLTIGDKTIDNILGTSLTFDKKGKTTISVDVNALGLTVGETYPVHLTAKYPDSEGGEQSFTSETTYVKYTTEKTSPSYADGIGMVYITTSRSEATKGMNLYTDKSKKKVNTSISILNADGTVNQAGAGTIKTRGNSTLNAQKKPYNISFDVEKDVFGMGAAKKWCLLSNIMDKSLIRNQVAFNFHNYVEETYQPGYAYSSKCKPVDLYIDGEYVGEYLLIEAVETGENRVNIDAENTENTDILLEIDGNGRDAATDAHLDARTSKYDMLFSINEPEGPGTSGAADEIAAYNAKYGTKKQAVMEFLNAFETAVEAKNYTTIQEYIDVDSFVNFYITSELFKTKDIGFSSTRYYIKDGKLYAGPLWDLDLSAGNSDDGGLDKYDDLKAKNDNAWFGALLAVPEFEAAVKSRFTELLPKIEELAADNGKIDNTYDEVKTAAGRNFSVAYNVWSSADNGYRNGWLINGLYGGSEVLGEEMYGNSVVHDTYEEYIADYKTWMSNRINVLKKVYGPEDAPDLTEVQANTPDVTNTDEWIAKHGLNGATINNTYNADKTLQYFIAKSYANGGTNNKFFTNDNIYGFYAKGSDVTYSQCPADILTNGAYGISSDKLRELKLKSVWVGQEKLVSGTDYYWQDGNDVLAISSEKFALGETENQKVYYVTVRTADGADYSWPIMVKRVGGEEEQAPDLSNVTLPAEDGWTQVTDGAAINGSKYYYPTNGVVSNIAQFKDLGSQISYGGAEANTVNAPAFGFSVNTGDNPESVWVGTKKLSSDASYVNTNVVTVAQSEFDLGDKEEDIFYVTLRYSDKDVTIPIKVVALGKIDTAAINDWVEFDVRDNKSNESIYGTKYYVSREKLATISKNTGVSGTYDGTNRVPQWNWDNNVSVYGEPVLGWICENGTKGVEVDGKFLTANSKECAFGGNWVYINQSVFALNAGEAERIFIIRLYGNSDDEYFAMKVVNPNVEETTTPGGITPTTEPTDAEWTLFRNSNTYYYYVPAGNEEVFKIADNQLIEEQTGLYFGMQQRPDSIKVNGVSVENLMADGAQMRLSYDNFSQNGAYQVTFTANNKEYTVWIKKETPKDYKPTGVLATSDATAKTATVKWTPSADAIAAGCTYTVQIANLEPVAVVGAEATVDITSLTFGSYDVTVNAVDASGNVLGSTKIQFEYKDPDKVDSNLSTQYQWEGRRRERLSWDKVDNATGYAIYTDGKLFETTTDLNMDVYAYAFANAENTNGQKTTVGNHTTKVVALFDGEEAPAYDQINEKHVIGENSFDLYVNYIFGRYTDIWNTHAEKSLWAFTICESGDAPATDKGKVVKGADAKVIYNDDGSANVTINDVGKHSSFQSMDNAGDQAWTIKTASYDAPVTKDQLVNLSYDITGPASLVGQEIRIKVCAEETDENGVYINDEYLNKYYTFVDDGNGGAVIHFTETFTSTNDTYDMFFGLGLLQNPDDENKTPIELTVEEAEAKDIYGVHSVTASPVHQRTEETNLEGNHTTHGIMVQWETDVPYRLRKEYTYEVYIDGIKTTEGYLNGEAVSPDDARSGATWYDYECGPEPGKEHKVEVVSYYNGTETARVETNVFVRNRTYPDLIISNVVVQNNDTKEYYTGDSVPVDVTIKNISAIDAVAADGEIAVHLYLRKPDGTLTGQKAWFVVDSKDENGKKILKAGEEVTKTMYYTVNPEDAGANWRYTFVARADADGKVDEGRYEDNNDFARTFIFLATPDPVTFNNDGTNVSISWPGVEMAHHYLINYVSNGETKSIETRNNNTSYVLNDVLDNNSTVEVYSVRSNGAQVIRAEGTALADLTITDIGPVGVATVNKPVNFKGTIKNVGAARATSGNNEKIIALTISGSDGVSDWSSYASVSDGLAPNETVDITVGGNYTPKTEGKFTLTGNVNDSGRIPEVDRKAGPVDTENNNNRKAFDINVVPSGTLNLINVDGNVYADFTLDTENTIQMYAVTYTSNGVEKTDYVAPEDVITGNRIALNAPLDNLSTVSIAARYTADDEYFTFATDTAKVDLTVSKIEIVNENGETLTENFKVNTFEEFYARTYITNIGTAQVKAYHSDSWEEEYANAIFVTARDADGKVLQGNQQDAIEQYNEGLTVGATATVDVGTIQLSKQGKQTINVKVDDPGWDVEGYITESNEENNTMSVELDVNLVQQPMDWTPLYDSTDLSKIYDFEVANSSLKRSIEYKVLDTSYTDIDYKDLVTKATGYNAFYMSIGFEDNHKIVNVNQETGKMAWSYTNTWFQQVEKSYLVDQNGNATGNVQVIDNEYLSRIHSQGCDIYGYDGKFFENTAQTQLGYAGNGFNFNVNGFAPGKYYMMTIVDYDPDSTDDAGNMKMRNYVTLAFRVTTELEGWTHVGASDATDINKLAAFYHDSDHQVDARFYYDCSDLGLACIKAYNGTHFTLTTDTAKKLNDDVNKTKIEIAYGVYDEAANKVVAPENWDTVCVNPGIYGKEGTNNLQIDIASLMRKLPLHSAKGGQTDYEYYFLKVYYDTESEPDSFIPVPMMVATEIPKIIPVQGLEVTNRGSLMTVNWTATNAQVADGYLYDIYIDGNLAKENVQAGSYNFAGSGNIGEQHKIVVKAKWCEQEALAEVDYVMKEPETEPVETIPSEKPTYPPANDHKWVLINGQNILPIGEKGMFEDQTVNAQIWYYTDDDINSVIGYNDYYISLNGSDKYFTGQSTKIYVQNGDSTTFESKTVYDSYYKGQTQMNAARMFQTYGEWQKGDTLYYTVRVAGNNGNTYKDFYFKVIPKDASPSITTTGDWRNISGEYKLPVKMGENSELQGTVRFLDCPLPTNKYTTGTNTYDIIGYNGYYMSIIGDTHYYTGENTKIYVSQAKDTVQYAENAANLTFTEKTIYDKVYPGQIIIKCAETFTVEYATTYYLLKVESGDQVTYIPVEIKVNTGDVEVLGFQMNTNHNAGGVAEHSPSFRVVSKTSKVMTIGNKLYEVQKMGTVYAAADVVDDDTLKQNMTLAGAESNDYIQSYETTLKGTLQGYTTTESDSKYNTYFALTFKFNDYMYHTIEQNYAVRAYAVLDDGTVVYGHNIYKTSMYEIAQNLYEGQKMGTKDAHDFLYNNILNLVDMNNHRTQIANAMFKALEIRTSSDSRYKTINTMTKDIYDYAKCQNGYTYKDREPFRCSEVEDELLQLLNGVSGNEKTYTSVYDWIYTEVPKYGKKDGTKYQGCYRIVEYGWDNTIDKDFYTE